MTANGGMPSRRGNMPRSGHRFSSSNKISAPSCRNAARPFATRASLSTVTAAFFPGYLFVLLDLNRDRWRSVNGTFGISSLVMAGELPCPVPAGIVETMLALADAEGLLQLSSNLKVGAPVRFAAGPFAEQLGVIDRLDNAGRIRVLLNILGRQVPVRLNRNYALPAA